MDKQIVKMKLLVLVILLVFSNTLNAQSFCKEVIGDNGESDSDIIEDIIRTNDGNYTFVMTNGSSTDSNMKTIVGKIDQNGDKIWMKRFDMVDGGYSNREEPVDIFKSGNNDLIFISNTPQSFDNDNLPGFSIARITQNGVLVDTAFYYRDLGFEAVKGFERPNGDILIFGNARENLFFLLLDADFNFKRAQTIESLYEINARKVVKNNLDGFHIIGTGYARVDLTYSIKLNPDLSVAWAKAYKKPNERTSSQDITILPNGKMIIVGRVYDYNHSTFYRGFLLFTDENGVLLSTKEFSKDDRGIYIKNITRLMNGNFLLSGTSSYSSVFGTVIDNLGNTVSTKQYGRGNLHETILALNGGLILTGSVSGEGYLMKTNSDGSSCCEEELSVVNSDVPNYQTISIDDLTDIEFTVSPTRHIVSENYGYIQTNCTEVTSARPENQIPELEQLENQEKKIRVFPNPAKGVLNISLTDQSLEASFELINVSGQKVTEGKLTALTTQIPVKTLEKGIYILKINNGEQSGNHIIIKE